MIKNKRFLPIGTVLMLKNGTKKVMINAYGVFSTTGKKIIYEYGACLYPEGILDSNSICVFNHDDIEQIFHLGFFSEEQEIFCEKLDENFDNYMKSFENA